MNNPSIIVISEQVSKKTLHAQEIANLLGLENICDEWHPDDRYERFGVLYLTNINPFLEKKK